MMKGATPIGSGSTPSAIAVIVALPASATSYTCAGSIPPSAQTSSASACSVSAERLRRRSRAFGSSIVAEMREITSAPNGCCLFSIERTARGVPVVTSRRVATTVVVPRSNAIACWCAVVSPGSTSMSRSSTTTAVTRKSDCRRTGGSRRSTPASARSSRSSTASWSRSKSVRWSCSAGSSSSTYRFCSTGWRITCRPTPTVAALGRVTSGGTSTFEVALACARHARRQPSSSSAGVKARASSGPAGTSPWSIRTRHFLHVP